MFIPVFSIEENTYIPQPTLASWSNSAPSYLRYYKVDDIYMEMSFFPLSKEKEKSLNKYQKKEYKRIKKIEKYLSKGWLYNAYQIDYNYLPTLIKYFKYYEQNKKYRDALIYLEKIRILDKYNIFNKNILEMTLGELYYFDNDYKNAIKYILTNIDELLKSTNTDDYYLRSIVADSYLQLKDYNNAIKQANKIKKDELDSYKTALLIKFESYLELKNIQEANKIAYELYSYSCPSKYSAALKIAETATDKNTQLKFYNIAKNNSTDENNIWLVNYAISKIEQEKLENICKKSIEGFFKIPNWQNIVKADANLMTISQENKRFNDYYNEIHVCTSKYNGNNLKSCLNNVMNEQEKITQRLITEHQERNRQIAEQQRLMQLQQMNANIQQQNALIQQQNYQLSRPRYYNSTTTQYGNTYYTNTYSY